jgi:hypothetical protein
MKFRKLHYGSAVPRRSLQPTTALRRLCDGLRLPLPLRQKNCRAGRTAPRRINGPFQARAGAKKGALHKQSGKTRKFATNRKPKSLEKRWVAATIKKSSKTNINTEETNHSFEKHILHAKDRVKCVLN